MNQDEEHLKLLSIFHYVVAGLAGLFACFPIIHLAIGLAFILAPHKFEGKGEAPPVWFGWLFVIVASVFITLGWIFAGALVFGVAGRSGLGLFDGYRSNRLLLALSFSEHRRRTVP